MTTTEAILQGDDRNFIINFGPKYPAAHGVLCLVSLLGKSGLSSFVKMVGEK